MAMVRTQILLTEEQAEALHELAANEGVSMAELVRKGVDHVIQSRRPLSKEERKALALSVVGRFHADATDLSREHDRYLDEAYAAGRLSSILQPSWPL